MKANILQAKKAFFAFFTMLIPLLASAHDFEVNGIYYNITSSTEQTVAVTCRGGSYNSYYNEYKGSVTIPSTVTYRERSYNVTRIENSAFRECSILTTISIPESMASIGEWAFAYCSRLTTINIPEGVTSIEDYAFSNCSSLTNITLPESMTNIGYGAFTNCSSLTTINIPENTTIIENGAFSGCSSLTDITIPENTTIIENSAFSGCSSLTDITIPEGVTSIGRGAFSRCSNLTSITVAEGNTVYDSRGGCNAIIETNSNTLITGCSSTVIPESVTSIGVDAFYDHSNLTTINIPESVTSIENAAFYGCRNLTTITIPKSVTSIGDYAFYECSNLTAINIIKGVMYIGNYAFKNCSRLTTINIPESVRGIGNCAFYKCSNLTSINVDEGNTVYDSRNSCNAIIETSSNTLIVGCSTTIIPKGVTSIGDYAFYECSSLIAINIPDGVTYIGNYAFENCYCLTGITFPESVTSIGNGAFEDCQRLISITCKSLTPPTIVDGSFYNVDKFIPVYVPTSSVEVYQSAEGWNKFTNIIGIELSKKCATPTISYIDGEVAFACDIEEVTIKSEIQENSSGKFEGTKISLIPTYTITAYATKENYEDSDVATLTLCWIPCTEEHESEETGILTIPSKPVLINARDGVLTLCGLEESTVVTLYTTDGTRIAHQQSSAGEATFTVDVHQVYIVHIGDKVVKIGM